MLVGAIKHISDEGVEKYLSSLEGGLEFCYNLKLIPDIVIGPDYALSQRHAGDIDEPNNQKERQEILKQIKEISKKHPKTRVIPGTMFWHDTHNAYHSTPMYSAGKMIGEFFKKRSNGEGEIAEKLSLNYKRGDNSLNNFIKNEKKISVEICGDHGTQDVTNVNLQLILAYDNKAGFYINTKNDHSTRYGLVCNGFDGRTKLQHYDSDNHIITCVKPVIAHEEIDLYTLMDSYNHIRSNKIHK